MFLKTLTSVPIYLQFKADLVLPFDWNNPDAASSDPVGQPEDGLFLRVNLGILDIKNLQEIVEYFIVNISYCTSFVLSTLLLFVHSHL